MRAVFHALTAIADITDYEFHVLAFYVSGSFKAGMLVRFRPQSRLGRTYILHSIESDALLSRLERRPTYRLNVKCRTREETEFLYDLGIKDEDFELVSSPDD